VLASGGRFTVSDIVFQGSQPQALRTNVASWDGCIVKALEEETYRNLLRDAGFADIEVEVTRRYALADIAGNGAPPSTRFPRRNDRRWMVGSSARSFALASRSKARSLLSEGRRQDFPGLSLVFSTLVLH
jgi:arsenite methyltransferase